MGSIFAAAGLGIIAFIAKGGHSVEHNAWVAYVVGGGFAAIGVAMLLTASDRRVEFDGAMKVARLISRGLFNVRAVEYPFSNIRDIALECRTS